MRCRALHKEDSLLPMMGGFYPLYLKYFPRIEYAVRIKYLFDAPHEVQINFAHGNGHVGAFGNANTVFTRKCSAQAYGEFENFTDTLRNFCLPIVLRDTLFEDVHMQVAITQVAKTNGVESVRLANGFDAGY